MADLRKALEIGDLQAIKDKTEALKQASYKIAEEIYKQQAAAQQGADKQPGGDPNMGGMGGSGQSGSGGNNNNKGAEDADYEVVDEK